ncbi:YgiW/YdeI family stress tolerance OB fold protein [Entomomonas asaccharolytica]|uniref:YgiW/YdeI family stress tolerance OB fold protein n=1 Tax=Entomomonas asaccharolytica TaxID=2785331 RepID=A0A974RWJ5_9GAMM|nr:NirD/YgiW/YdeI family stress tolerance protein [Entomomonas asaccharolytica]QQP85207.1 YgiW/YdeI family stress tolerance OB fold protein [Entomomonas asaccharolytica]
MKKALVIATALLTLGSTAAFAQQGGFTGPSSSTTEKGGYSGPRATTSVTTVEQAKQMRDDSKVTLRGNIVKHLGKEKYTFKDNTGEITVEIDDDDWRGVTVGPNDLVEIYGEVDKDWNSVEIDVDTIRKVK